VNAETKSMRRLLISALQDGLPICAQPYLEIARQLGLSEDALLMLLEAMLDEGTIRRVGMVPNHYALGYNCNIMSVWDIEDSQIQTLGKAVGELSFVSHCYQRPRCLPDWPYNLFAMVHGKSEAESQRKLVNIEQLLGESNRGYSQLISKQILKKSGLRIQQGAS
jgi:DNA-binding Lrp family transcriptional regulator